MEGPKLAKVVEALHELETPWLVFADNDESGRRALSQIVDPATGIPLDTSHERVVLSGEKQMEQLLVDAGYLAEIKEVAKTVGITIAEEKEALDFLKSNKGWAAEAVARTAVDSKRDIPQPVKNLAAAIRNQLELIESETPR